MKSPQAPSTPLDSFRVQPGGEDKLGRTPLHNAVAAGCDELAKGLLEEKARQRGFRARARVSRMVVGTGTSRNPMKKPMAS